MDKKPATIKHDILVERIKSTIIEQRDVKNRDTTARMILDSLKKSERNPRQIRRIITEMLRKGVIEVTENEKGELGLRLTESTALQENLKAEPWKLRKIDSGERGITELLQGLTANLDERYRKISSNLVFRDDVVLEDKATAETYIVRVTKVS